MESRSVAERYDHETYDEDDDVIIVSSSRWSGLCNRIFCKTPVKFITRRKAWYCLIMLCVLNALDQADRWGLPTLQAAGLQCSSCGAPGDEFYDDCKGMCLEISDFQMGLLTGPSFSLTSLAFSVPFGYFADYYNRVVILFIGLVIWSSATIGTAFAQEFIHIFIMRICLGIGQAAVNPAAYSLISDYFPPTKRAFSLSIFATMIYFGQVFGLMSGILSQATSWRLAFLVLGLPGLVVAIPFLLTVDEPVRGLGDALEEDDSNQEEQVPLAKNNSTLSPLRSSESPGQLRRSNEVQEGDRQKQEEKEEEDGHDENHHEAKSFSPETVSVDGVLTNEDVERMSVFQKIKYLALTAPFVAVWLCAMCRYMAGYAIGSWIQVFYRRVFGVEPSVLSLYMSIILPTGGLTAALTGGKLADFWYKRDVAGKAWVCCLSSFFGSPLMAAVLLVPYAKLSFGCLWLEYAIAEAWFAPSASIALDVNPAPLRAFASAIYVSAGAIGGLSPALIGWLNILFDDELPQEEV